MSRLTSGNHGALSRMKGEMMGRGRSLLRQEEYSGPSPEWVVVGVVAVGVGLLAWHYLGPDVRRYIKLRNM